MTRYFHAMIALLAVAVSPAAAHAQAETSTSALRDGGITGFGGTCEGESAVVTDGSIMSVFHTTYDATGGMHFIVNTQFREPGTGEETGDNYLWMRSSHLMLNMDAAKTFRNGGRDLMLAPGPGDDANQYSSYQSTQNANGETTVSFDRVRVDECG
jgi:hypothetical protein